MVPRKFEYFAPTTVKAATTLLKKYGPDAKILAGGMSLLPVMKLRLGSPAYIVDINRIPGLEYVKQSGSNILIGALTRHHDIQTSKLIKEKAMILSDCAGLIGDAQVRNMGTMGGSLSHCDPSGDWGAAVLAMRGVVKLRGPSKDRTMKIDDFLVDTFTSALKPNELLTEISIPIPSARSGGAYVKLERKTGDFATVAVGVQLTLDAKGTCSYAGIGLTALGNKNLRATRAEAALLGKPLTSNVVEEAAEAASEDAEPTNDPLRGSAEYKKEMAKVYTRRGLQLAISRAKGGKQ
ncbi:MAG: xanthine dehydrogenase family protein subunit M [Thaumarchaeota archaeon]|nr:xanthine dehydrogenase family protein subunit M [Nitrososphaerota archaeon]